MADKQKKPKRRTRQTWQEEEYYQEEQYEEAPAEQAPQPRPYITGSGPKVSHMQIPSATLLSVVGSAVMMLNAGEKSRGRGMQVISMEGLLMEIPMLAGPQPPPPEKK
eukprot:gnl/TRDRNA2_/TRDRNA2_179263_c0_seq1.p2 gnl/TRDRNA2_/TRDRNA2_179263_c0~~gnl/TRDRNA2_/TRDRNA2_179263_c0_seq1.p2  ORF type:complete len:108 (+),score=29.58 gnl/TRDRNA2_/TRDRNA2_179263_c0_seq1:92-415(+)